MALGFHKDSLEKQTLFYVRNDFFEVFSLQEVYKIMSKC